MLLERAIVYRYGDHESQWIRLTSPPKPWSEFPDDGIGGLPVCVLIHGGFWKNKWTADNTCITSLVPDLAARGFVVMEIEYRRRDDEGGGWPGTNQDCLDALNTLLRIKQESRLPLDLDCVTVIGHSAGGALALWLGTNSKDVVPRLVVGVASVCDLREAYRARLSDEGDAVELYMKCTPDSTYGEDAYDSACPTSLLPLRVPTLIVAGSCDTDVPAYMALRYYTKAMEARERSEKVIGDAPTIELLELTGADHMAPLTSGSPYWDAVIARVEQMLRR